MIRSISLLAVVFSCYHTSAFQPIGFHRPSRNVALRVSSELEKETPIIITGRNIELTPALVEYVNKRIGGPLKKLSSNGAVRECDVHLSVSKNPKVKDGHRVEITANLKGTRFHAKEESPDMYTSIDSVAADLSRKLRRYKERRMDGWHGGGPMAEDIMEVLDIMDKDFAESEGQVAEEYVDDFSDPGAPTITKIKSYDLDKPISLQEAIFALDYTDHDFYVFRDAETNEISVVYKRNSGGIGLVQP